MLALVCCAVLGLALQTAQWKEYPYASDGFAVSTPSEPSVSKQTVKSAAGDVEIHYYSIPLVGDKGFMICAATLHPADRRTPQEILTEGKRGAVDAVKAKITSETQISIAGYPGVQIDFEAEKYHGRSRLYSVGRMLYQVMTVAPTGQPIAEETARFYGSFRLLNVPK
jgi:hypothetical protein